jgi:hypothetical protein
LFRTRDRKERKKKKKNLRAKEFSLLFVSPEKISGFCKLSHSLFLQKSAKIAALSFAKRPQENVKLCFTTNEISRHGDQMSLRKKISQNAAQYTFLSKLMHNLKVAKKCGLFL